MARKKTKRSGGKATSSGVGSRPSRASSAGSPRARSPQKAASQPPADAPRPSQPDPTHPHDPTAFPIIGIGASAGGLQALDQFFHHVPADSGMAFVIVQHLDPTQKGMLPELLQRAAAIPVTQATDEIRVRPNHAYVIPPNSDISLLHGALHLLPQTSPRGLGLPIDSFFRSLAEDQQERSIGVILSGMGSDGTLGLRAIKEKAGVAFVQTLTSARFDGMPRSAIEAGVADVVAPAEELPARILSYSHHSPQLGRSDPLRQEKAVSAMDKVFVLLRAHTGNDFSLYKRSTIFRRVERRMGLHQIDDVSQYVRYLRENPREIDLLFKELLIGVTSFFRDPPAWEQLGTEVMPRLLVERASAGVLRAWVPGCSTGEEAYSLAMVFREALDRLKPALNLSLQIFATDLDRDAIEKARLGQYPDSIAAEVSSERLSRFFVKEPGGFRVSKEIREMVVFAPQNIIMDPPFTKLDILCCRNLLIYLSGELQKKIIPLFHYSLCRTGILFLGSAETIGGFSTLFSTVDNKARVYQRVEPTAGTLPVEFPSHYGTTTASEGELQEPEAPLKSAAPNLQALVDRLLVQRFAPVGVLCTDKGEILYISTKAGKYLEPAVGRANMNLFAMAREGLRYELSGAFAASLREDRAVTVRNIKVSANGAPHPADLIVQRLSDPKELKGTVLVVIADAPAGPAESKPLRPRRTSESPRLMGLEDELKRAREELQTTREEMQTSQEELKSTNEELQSTNEEMQSTNEELTTSKEEMQSLNEELQTVNHELQAKVDELSRSGNDMKNLLNSTDIATLFLDGQLKVRRFTTPTARIIKLIPADMGRAITDIATDLDYPELPGDCHEVLRTLVFKEKQVSSRANRFFDVRVMPYRTLDNVIDGVVITFSDATATRTLEMELRQRADQLRQITESFPGLVWGCRPEGTCDYLNKKWVDYTGVPAAAQMGFGWLEQVHPDDREGVREKWRAAVKSGNPMDTKYRLRDASGAHRWFRARMVPIRTLEGAIDRWYGTLTEMGDHPRSDRGAL